jgi:hypothetical protein
METEQTHEILAQVAQVIDERFAKHDRDAARDLLYHLDLLPWELQERYWEYAELTREGKRAEASRAWEEWLEQARDLGLI